MLVEWLESADAGKDVVGYEFHSGTVADFTPTTETLIYRGNNTSAVYEVPIPGVSKTFFIKVGAMDTFNISDHPDSFLYNSDIMIVGYA